MKFSTFQESVRSASRFKGRGAHQAITPMLGLAGETGSILNVYKKYLRDRIDLEAHRDLIGEELGDALWYVAAIANILGLDLEEIAKANLGRAEDLYGGGIESASLSSLPVFDAGYPESERFPRSLTVEFSQEVNERGLPTVSMTLIEAIPDAFPNGSNVTQVDGKKIELGYQVGSQLGDPLDDNTDVADAYRFHDAIHFGFLSVLNWSPNSRSLLKIKRRSNADVDRTQDGARAIFAEEGLATILSRLARRRMGLTKEVNIDGEIIEIARASVADLEVSDLPGWAWRRAISQGFQAMHHLAENQGGYLVADLDARTLGYWRFRP
ncbi:hypothetical protein [Streptomyces sp. NBC_00040]|uniref:nucleoside triphosphate pyrophosphohydrolase family protein n=1 Tax=Streptomyces sp. NBC_00040 TaxID=2903616 RepID=UPI00324648C5